MLTYTSCDRHDEKFDFEDDQVNTARRLDGFHLSDTSNCPRSPVQLIGGRQSDGPNLTQVTQPAIRNDPGITVFGSVADRPDKDVAPPSSDLRLCEEQRMLVDLVLSRANVFFTGGAGTGKSTVLRAIVKELRNLGRHVEVVTPTGVAALNVGGTTYFTYAGWTPGVMKESIEEIEKMAWSTERRDRMKTTEVLVIDETSMMESNQFRRLDRACRAARESDAAFGGMQVIVTGDFYQLPPVKAFYTCFTCGHELRQMVCPRCHKTYDIDEQWAFRSDTWDACRFVHVSLTQVHRQCDPAFIAILSTLRTGARLSHDQLSLLSNRKSDVDEAVELSPLRKEVDEKNATGFRGLPGLVRAYRCRDHVYIEPHHPHLASKAAPDGEGCRVGCQDHRFPRLLETKFGMPVILLANISVAAGLVNGSQGRIVGYASHKARTLEQADKLRESGEVDRLTEQQVELWASQQVPGFSLPVVRFENGAQLVVYPVCQGTLLGDPRPFSVVARTQIPLLPAWAITIHKSQGMTLEKAVVNLEQVFEPQMAYVALSRLRSLSGLKINSRVSLDTLQEWGKLGGSSRTVRTFMEGVPSVREVVNKNGKMLAS